MEKKYDQNEFISKLQEKMGRPGIPPCPFCGGNEFSAIDSYATLIINTDLNQVNIGPNIPAGIVVCNKCGHMEFFALGALGMLSKKDGDNNGAK